MMKQKTININEHEYLISLFFADIGLEIFFDLLKYLGVPLVQLLKSSDIDNVLDSSITDAFNKLNIEGLITGLVANNSKDVIVFIKKLLSQTLRDEKALTDANFKFAYAGNYGELIKILKEIIIFNYFGEDTENFFSQIISQHAEKARVEEVGRKN